MPCLLSKGSMALAENWAWAVTRVVAEKQDAPQGCGRIRPCWRRGRVRDANKHDNLAELTTFSDSICYNPDGWPDGRMAGWPDGPTIAWGSGHEGFPMAALETSSSLPA